MHTWSEVFHPQHTVRIVGARVDNVGNDACTESLPVGAITPSRNHHQSRVESGSNDSGNAFLKLIGGRCQASYSHDDIQ